MFSFFEVVWRNKHIIKQSADDVWSDLPIMSSNPFHNFDTFSPLFRGVLIWWSQRPLSWAKWGSSGILFTILTLFHHFSEEFLPDVPLNPQVQQSSEDPQGSLSAFWHFLNIFECSSHPMIPKSAVLIWWSPRATSTAQWGSPRILFTIVTLLYHLYLNHFFSQSFRGVLTWCYPRPPSPIQWGTSRILFTILTLFHPFSEEVLSGDHQDPQVQSSEDPVKSFSPFLHFFTIFQFSSYLMIPNTTSPT